MKNFKRDLKFMCLSDAIANARPGEPLEVWYKGSPSPNRSILETFSLVARVHNQEQWSTLYFFLWKYVRTEADVLRLLYEKMKIKPLSPLKPDECLSAHAPFLSTIQPDRLFLCFDNCQAITDQILNSIKYLSLTLNCRLLILHRPSINDDFRLEMEPRLKRMFKRSYSRS